MESTRSHCIEPFATSPTAPTKTPLSDLNGRGNDVQPSSIALVDDKLQQILKNPKFTAPVQVGMEVTKVLFTEIELVMSSLTG